MDHKELLKERFRIAISSAVKAISENYDIDVKFSNNQKAKKNILNLPEISDIKNIQDYIDIRAIADSEALKIKYTNKKIYIENEPMGKMAKELYAIAEKIRYEKIGSDRLRGVKNNITQHYNNKYKTEIQTKIIAITFFLLNFSLKKTKPNKTLIIGIMKYPKLASIILFEATA